MLPENRPLDYRISTTATEDEKTCLKCRHLETTCHGNGYDEPSESEPECIKHPWDTLPDGAIESDAWEIECPKYCGNFEAIATEGEVS